MKPRHLFALALTSLLVAAACGKGSEPAAHAAPSGGNAPAAVAGDARLVEITVTGAGYSPKVIEAKQGEKLVLRFTRKVKGECLSQVVFPDQKIKQDLPMDKPVDIAITAEKPGKIPFQCGMAMVFGSINVS